MRKLTKTLVIAVTFAAGVAVAPAIYAQMSSSPHGSMMGSGMMGSGMMGEGGMMEMMGQMSGMMEQCQEMMDGMQGGEHGERPNEQWRESPSDEPDT